jgi:hypothetical protein
MHLDLHDERQHENRLARHQHAHMPRTRTHTSAVYLLTPPAPSRVSARLRSMEGAQFETVPEPPAVPPAAPPARRGRPRARAVPPAPSRASARLRSQSRALFETVLGRAVRRKAGQDVAPSSATPAAPPPPPFQPEELLAMAHDCQLPAADVRRLADAALVPGGAP